MEYILKPNTWSDGGGTKLKTAKEAQVEANNKLEQIAMSQAYSIINQVINGGGRYEHQLNVSMKDTNMANIDVYLSIFGSTKIIRKRTIEILKNLGYKLKKQEFTINPSLKKIVISVSLS